MFLQQEGQVNVPGYVWYGHNRVRDNHASGGVGLLVKKNIWSNLLLRIEGAVWVELQVVEGNNMIVGMVYVNPEGVRVQESEMFFKMMKAKVTNYEEAGFEVLVPGDFIAHVGLGAEQSPNRNGRKLLDLVRVCDLRVGNKL